MDNQKTKVEISYGELYFKEIIEERIYRKNKII